MNKKVIFLLVLLITTLFSSTIYAKYDIHAKYHGLEVYDFEPDGYTFVYGGKNTTTYEGDLGLKGALTINKKDNTMYFLDKNEIMGIAYETNGTFKLDGPIKVTRFEAHPTYPYEYLPDECKYHVGGSMFHENGDQIFTLSIGDDLTLDQQKYFTNYEQQKYEYYQKEMLKKQDYLADIEDSYYSRSLRNKQPQNYYYVGSNGYGFVHSY